MCGELHAWPVSISELFELADNRFWQTSQSRSDFGKRLFFLLSCECNNWTCTTEFSCNFSPTLDHSLISRIVQPVIAVARGEVKESFSEVTGDCFWQIRSAQSRTHRVRCGGTTTQNRIIERQRWPSWWSTLVSWKQPIFSLFWRAGHHQNDHHDRHGTWLSNFRGCFYCLRQIDWCVRCRPH